jgi:hypothetical protein
MRSIRDKIDVLNKMYIKSNPKSEFGIYDKINIKIKSVCIQLQHMQWRPIVMRGRPDR